MESIVQLGDFNAHVALLRRAARLIWTWVMLSYWTSVHGALSPQQTPCSYTRFSTSFYFASWILDLRTTMRFYSCLDWDWISSSIFWSVSGSGSYLLPLVADLQQPVCHRFCLELIWAEFQGTARPGIDGPIGAAATGLFSIHVMI